MNKTWKKLLGLLVEKEYDFDLVNNVLTFDDPVADEKMSFWYWFGRVLEVEDGKVKAGEMNELVNIEYIDDNGFVYTTHVKR